MGLDGVHILEIQARLIERPPGRRQGRLGHMRKVGAGEAKTQKPYPDRRIGGQFRGAFGGGHQHAGIAVGRVGLAAEGHRSLRLHRLQFFELVRRCREHAFVAGEFAGLFFKAGIGHGEGQAHIALVEGVIVGAGLFVLAVAHQHDLVLLGR